MPLNLKIIALTFIALIITIITLFVKNKRISIKYSIVWYLSSLVLLLLVMFPSLLRFFADLLKIQVASNMIFAFIIGFLFIITMSLSIIVSEQKEQIRLLIQEVSLLKKRK